MATTNIKFLKPTDNFSESTEAICMLSKKFRNCTVKNESITYSEDSTQKYQEALHKWVLDNTDNTPKELKEKAENKILNCLKIKKKSLNLSYLSLNSIPPLFELKHLESLSLNHNNLKRITPHCFSKLTKLETLELNHNRIDSLNGLHLSQCTKLTNLFLKHNKLVRITRTLPSTSPPFSLPPKLENLDLSNNQITEIDLTQCPNIHLLKIVQNNLRKLDKIHFHPSCNLQILNASHNKWETIEQRHLPKLPKLRALILSRSNLKLLKHINLGIYPKLELLDLSYNQLKYIYNLNLSYNSKLKNIFLEHNQLQIINYHLPISCDPNLAIMAQHNFLNYDHKSSTYKKTNQLTLSEPLDPLNLNPQERLNNSPDLYETLAKWSHSPYHPLWKKIIHEPECISFINLLEQDFENVSLTSYEKKEKNKRSIKKILTTLEDLYPCETELKKCYKIAEIHINNYEIENGINAIKTYLEYSVKNRQGLCNEFNYSKLQK